MILTTAGTSEEHAIHSTQDRALQGPVMAIGGAEDKFRDRVILSRFVELAGGPHARIVVVPTASSIESAGEAAKGDKSDGDTEEPSSDGDAEAAA